MINSFILFLSISGGEILIIILVVYLVFGPKKIPELARMLGKGMNELRRATDDIKKEINKETGKIKKDMDIGIDLKDPLNMKKSGNQKEDKTSANKPQAEQAKEKNTKEESTEDVTDDKPIEENQDNTPQGSVPRS